MGEINEELLALKRMREANAKAQFKQEPFINRSGCGMGIFLNPDFQPTWRWNFVPSPEKDHGGWVEVHCNRPEPHPRDGEHSYTEPGEVGLKVSWNVPKDGEWLA